MGIMQKQEESLLRVITALCPVHDRSPPKMHSTMKAKEDNRTYTLFLIDYVPVEIIIGRKVDIIQNSITYNVCLVSCFCFLEYYRYLLELHLLESVMM